MRAGFLTACSSAEQSLLSPLFSSSGSQSKSESPQSIVFKLRVQCPSQSYLSPLFSISGSKSESPLSIVFKLRVWCQSQSLLSTFLSSTRSQVQVRVSSVHFFLVLVLSLTLKNPESGPIFRQWLSVPGCPVSESQSLSRCLDAAPLTSPSSWPPIGPEWSCDPNTSLWLDPGSSETSTVRKMWHWPADQWSELVLTLVVRVYMRDSLNKIWMLASIITHSCLLPWLTSAWLRGQGGISDYINLVSPSLPRARVSEAAKSSEKNIREKYRHAENINNSKQSYQSH